MVFVASLGRLYHPIQSLVFFSIVDLLVSAVEHQHGEPLEAAKELIEQKHLQINEPRKEQQIGLTQLIEYNCVPEEEVVGEVVYEQVLQSKLIH